MPMLVLFILLYLAAIALIIVGGVLIDRGISAIGGVLLAAGILWAIVGIVPFIGLKILKPHEALVLTLFGEYIGTLNEPGFYYVHPFATAVNPAAKTHLGQSADVESKLGVTAGSNQLSTTGLSKKISLKIMTLNNAKQKVNDVLGNPVEIGVAVIWRVVDTAKAVFNVDNIRSISHCSVTALSEISYEFTHMMWPRELIQPATASQTKAVCAVQVQL